MSKLLVSINGRISKLQASERVTKVELGELSKETLAYTLEQWDSQVINRTLAVLSPQNQRTAVLFFKAFTPFNYDEQTKAFGGIKNKKAKAKCTDAINVFLSSGSDIWEWSISNTTIEPKVPNYLANITKNVTNAVSKSGSSTSDIVNAVLAAGITASEFTTVLMALEEEQEPEH